MTKQIPLKALSVLLALGMFAYLFSQIDEVSRAQITGFDRSQYADNNPVGDLEGQLPEAGTADVIIELGRVSLCRRVVQRLSRCS